MISGPERAEVVVRFAVIGWVLAAGCSKGGGSGDGPDSSNGTSDTESDTSGTTDTTDGETTDGGGDTDVPTTGTCPIFPADNPWNTDISDPVAFPVHARSDDYIASIGRTTTLHPDFGTVYAGAPIGIPYVYVDDSVTPVPINFGYDDESDPGPYPIPPDAPIEGGPDSDGDRHVIAIHTDDCLLYEMWSAYPKNGGASWQAGSGAIFDLNSNALRPDGWTSADAAGLPIFPGLVRYDEVVENGVIPHALRFTVENSQRGYIHPATHYASSDSDPTLPPMGLRVRMKASYDCSGYSSEVQVIWTAMKTYGMFMADNGSNWFVSGAPDDRWSDDRLGDLKDIPGSAFEAVDTGPILP
jgi:hypothetical protein